MEFRKFYGAGRRGATRQPRATATGDSHGEQLDSHGRRATATGPGDSHGAGRQPRGRATATGPGDSHGAGRRATATGSNSTAQKRGAGITGPFVTIGTSGINLAIVTDVKIDTTIHTRRIRQNRSNRAKPPIPIPRAMTVTSQPEVMAGRFVRKVRSLQSGTIGRSEIRAIFDTTGQSGRGHIVDTIVIIQRNVILVTTGPKRAFDISRRKSINRCNRHNRFPLLRCLFPVTL